MWCGIRGFPEEWNVEWRPAHEPDEAGERTWVNWFSSLRLHRHRNEWLTRISLCSKNCRSVFRKYSKLSSASWLGAVRDESGLRESWGLSSEVLEVGFVSSIRLGLASLEEKFAKKPTPRDLWCSLERTPDWTLRSSSRKLWACERISDSRSWACLSMLSRLLIWVARVEVCCLSSC